MKTNIWIFSLEPIETRYTCEWFTHLPKLLQDTLGDKFNVIQVDGIQKNTATTPGAFLNFSDTNYWKSTQLCKFLDHYNKGETTINDQFIFTDFWNPVIIQLKYMRDLLNLNWKLHGLVHAGSYDPQDFLGRLIGNAPWVRNTEKGLFYSLDHNYFATDFHIHMFFKNLLNNGSDVENSWCEENLVDLLESKKIVRSGWPMEYMEPTLSPYKDLEKENLILFPHRIAPEKQLEIFKDLEKQLPEYKFVVCQESQLTKTQYHTLLGKSKIVFSANLQETLGISTCSEGPLANSLPLAPNRLSYTEIFNNYPEFLYPSEWTQSWNDYCNNKEQLVSKIKFMMENYDQLKIKLNDYVTQSYPKYFTAKTLIDTIKENE